jgi:hypothetical protein
LYARSNPLVFIDVLGLDPDEAEAFWSSSAKQRAAQAFCGLAAVSLLRNMTQGVSHDHDPGSRDPVVA